MLPRHQQHTTLQIFASLLSCTRNRRPKLGFLAVLVTIVLLPRVSPLHAHTAIAQGQIVANIAGSQSCDELQLRGPEFGALAKACQYAVATPRKLPDFVCTETVIQYLSPKQKPAVITAELTIEKTRSHYSAVTVNGKQKYGNGDTIFEELVGSTGEFAMLFNVFDTSSHAEFDAPVDSVLDHRHVKRYDFRVKRENNIGWTWFFADASINPGYHGSIFVDPAAGAVFRLVVQVSSGEVDPQTPVSSATTTIDYRDVAIAEAGTHHVPVQAENTSCFRALNGCARAQLTFSNFHKFGSTSRIVPAPSLNADR